MKNTISYRIYRQNACNWLPFGLYLGECRGLILNHPLGLTEVRCRLPLVVADELLQFGGFLFGDLRFGWLNVVIAEEVGEQVFDGLAFGVAHGVHRGVGAFGHHLQFEDVAASVASDDAAHLPEAQPIEERVAVNAYLAYEQLVDVVGGNQFFPFVPFCASALALAASVPGRW